jgi:hypothetical protein
VWFLQRLMLAQPKSMQRVGFACGRGSTSCLLLGALPLFPKLQVRNSSLHHTCFVARLHYARFCTFAAGPNDYLTCRMGL